MILIESDNNQRQVQINADLMFADQRIETLRIDISKFGVALSPTKQLVKELLPMPVRNGKVSLTNWFIDRGLIRRAHRNIFFTELVLNLESRELCMPLILSLATNSISVSDKYWLNPIETTTFVVNGVKIVFEKKTWDEINPFVNLYLPGQLEQYGLYDCFFVEKPENLSPYSLIWTTHGEQNKRWMLGVDGYYLEKKLNKQQFEEELSTLDFFLLNGVLVPKYTYYVKTLDNTDNEYDCIYSVDTIQEGLHVIQKCCLTNANSYLEKLIDYVDNDTTIESPIKRMFTIYKVPEKETERFIKIIKDYQNQFGVKDSLLDTSNMGLLIENGKGTPVVWGRLQRKIAWNGQIV